MKWEVKDEKNCRKIITVHVDSDRVKEVEKKVFTRIKNNARVDGYRKGKVPENIIENMYKTTIKDEILKEIVPETYSAVMKELKLHIVTQPMLEEIKFEGKDDSEVSYKIAVELNPEFEIKDYKAIKVNNKELKEITEKDVEREINRVRQYRGNLKDTAKDTVEDKDYVTISMAGFVDNSAVAEMTDENYLVQVGSGMIIKDLEEGLRGMKVGQEKDINVVFPKDYHNKKYASKPALFKVKVKQIKVLEMPEANDDFAKSLGPDYDTLDKLKAAIKDELKKQADADIKNSSINQIIKELVEKNVFEIPQGLVDDEVENIIHRYTENLKQQGMTIEKLGVKLDDLRATSRKQAEENIRLIYLLRRIAEKEKIEVSDMDVETEILKIAENTKQNGEALIKQSKAKGSWDALKAKLIEDKVFEFMLNLVK